MRRKGLCCGDIVSSTKCQVQPEVPGREIGTFDRKSLDYLQSSAPFSVMPHYLFRGGVYCPNCSVSCPGWGEVAFVVQLAVVFAHSNSMRLIL